MEWSDLVTVLLSAILGLLGGAISGDIVAKRQHRRQLRTEAASKLADWKFVRLGSVNAELHNTGTEAGHNIRLEWSTGSSGRLHQDTLSRIDPGDFRRIEAGPMTPGRAIRIHWDRPDGTTHTVEREVPRFSA